MKVGVLRRSTRRTLVRVFLVLALGALQAPAALAAGECDPVMPANQVVKGMVGTGWTVVRGREPEPFAVEVLGVLPNEIGPGRDMIVVEASSPAIAQVGGIWFGMSGAPVYIEGKLIGAVAFGLGPASGASTVAGLTTAEDMLRILSYPSGPPSGVRAAPAGPAAVELPAAIVREIAESTGTPVGEVGNTMTQLKVPLSVSGLTARGMRHLNAFVKQNNLALHPYRGASASRASAAPPGSLPEPGDNFAAVSSYGDVTTAGMGTTSYVCNGKVLAFGHPLSFTGRTLMGANAAEALAIVPDPLLGPFKLAMVAEGLGRIDQDRLAGLRTELGAVPTATPIRTSVRAIDLGTSRDGATDVVAPDMTPFTTFLHLVSNIDSTFDAVGAGSSRVSWTIEGTRADGSPWQLARSNLYASGSDVAVESADEVTSQLDLIAANPFEEARVTGVRIDASVEEAVKLYTVSRVLVSRNGGPWRARRLVRARPGMRIGLRIVLTSFHRGAPRTVAMRMRVPRRARVGGAIEVSGGPMEPARPCFSGEECERGPALSSFDGILRFLASYPKNNVLTARLRLGPRGAVRAKRQTTLDAVVRGSRMVLLELPGSKGAALEGPPEGAEVITETAEP